MYPQLCPRLLRYKQAPRVSHKKSFSSVQVYVVRAPQYQPNAAFLRTRLEGACSPKLGLDVDVSTAVAVAHQEQSGSGDQ